MNFSFQMYQESGFWGHFLVLCTAGSLELSDAPPPGPPPGICPGPTGGLIALPRQSATPANEIWSKNYGKYEIQYGAFGRIPLSFMPSRQIWPITLNSFKKAWV